MKEPGYPGITNAESAYAALEKEIQFEALISELSATFVHLSVERVDSNIEDGLRQLGQYLRMDLGTLIQVDPEKSKLTVTHQWNDDTLKSEPPFRGVEITERNFPWLAQELRRSRTIRISVLDDFPPEAAIERETCEKVGIKSVAWVPYSISPEELGFVAFNTTREETVWTDSIVRRLQLAGEIFGNALARKRAWEGLEEQARFEQLIAEIASGFNSAKPQEIDRLLGSVLGRIGQFMNVERCLLGVFSEDDARFVSEYAWAAPGVALPPSLQGEWPADMFWFAKQTLGGEILAVTHRDELSPEPRAALESENITGFVIVPIVIEEQVIGDLVLCTVRDSLRLPDDSFARLRIVADVMGHAITRFRLDQELRDTLTENERLREHLEADNLYLRKEIEDHQRAGAIIGHSPAIQEVLALGRSVAETDSTVLILGETGTGKELLARFIHQQSGRQDRPLVKVNCGALPATLVEAELFGREKGAYTGAMSRQMGRFEIADGATIFLDEIGDLPLDLQVKLLRILEDGEFERLGGSKTIRVDVRVIAATNTDLAQAVQGGKFRQDLFYRLNVFPINVPPLRERPEDIPLLLWAFVREFVESMARPVESIPRRTMEALTRYSWPGNVRELRNTVERAMIVHRGPRLEIPVPSGTALRREELQSTSLDAVQRRHILKCLERTRWRLRGQGGAAELLDMKPSTLEYRMKKLNIQRPS